MAEWLSGFRGAFTICDDAGTILELTPEAERLFAKWGGAALVGRSVLDCHADSSRAQLRGLLQTRTTNLYTTEKDGIHRLVYQGPWETGNQRGYLELSFEVPPAILHRVRDPAPEQPVLETERLILRPLTRADSLRVAKLAGHRAVAQYTRLPHPYPVELAFSFISGLETEWKKERAAVFAIVPKGEFELVGAAGLHPGRYDRTVAETGYWLGVPYHGQGYATEAARRVCDWGLSHWGLRRIHASTYSGNRASERVLEKLGFQREGVQRAGVIRFGTVHDIVLWGLLAGELRT
jgi:ribosomal-protein-alanine N-acetyltransferase